MVSHTVGYLQNKAPQGIVSYTSRVCSNVSHFRNENDKHAEPAVQRL